MKNVEFIVNVVTYGVEFGEEWKLRGCVNSLVDYEQIIMAVFSYMLSVKEKR